eukprot:CAMPEP_0175861004 /NCGR_PEP_ID=MMETSP0107_2-20121207/31132_1 /TAXON_ID=195067 ORGANISM="Goniomonas pacifica, Strain CCMP1869" /NCGR_SAMPLE_ID=MMETSP0107_2 /ASSEMBLY_ACC=CAM_ASM_000203 /LENGTH=33 /DNA_ID= /DNA_START= /DNA_END= /DNA_ORIENTATION=
MIEALVSSSDDVVEKVDADVVEDVDADVVVITK